MRYDEFRDRWQAALHAAGLDVTVTVGGTVWGKDGRLQLPP
jgi:hypothetical protein